MTDTIKLLPQNLNAERSVLGCQMLDPRTVDPVAAIIGVKDFYADSHQSMQKAILALHGDGIPSDVMTVVDRLDQMQKLDDVGGLAYVTEILESVPHAGNAIHYAELVAETSRRRQAIAISRNLNDSAFNPSCSSAELLEAGLKSMMELTDLLGTVKKVCTTTLKEHVEAALESALAGVEPTLKCGIEAVDSATGGIAPGELVVIGGRPSHGKTLIGLQWIDSAAQQGIPGLIVSEEMPAELLAMRQLSAIVSIPRSDWVTSEGQARFEVRQHFGERAPVFVAEKCHTIAAIEREVARCVHQYGVRIVAVDYAQLIKGDGASRFDQVTDVSLRMKRMAVKHKIMLLLLAQLSRELEKRPDPTPRLSDLRESGQLEQDADVCLFCFWPIKLDPKYDDPTEYRIYQAKNRSRGVGTAVVQLTIQPTRQRLISRYVPDAAEDWEQR